MTNELAMKSDQKVCSNKGIPLNQVIGKKKIRKSKFCTFQIFINVNKNIISNAITIIIT